MRIVFLLFLPCPCGIFVIIEDVYKKKIKLKIGFL